MPIDCGIWKHKCHILSAYPFVNFENHLVDYFHHTGKFLQHIKDTACRFLGNTKKTFHNLPTFFHEHAHGARAIFHLWQSIFFLPAMGSKSFFFLPVVGWESVFLLAAVGPEYFVHQGSKGWETTDWHPLTGRKKTDLHTLTGRGITDLHPSMGRRKNDLDPMTGRKKTDWHPQRRVGNTT